MARPLFTPEELAELAAADADLDENFVQTQEERVASRIRDRQAVLAAMVPGKRRAAESKRAYREANKDKIAESKRAWVGKNREKWNAYMREYRARKRENKCTETLV